MRCKSWNFRQALLASLLHLRARTLRETQKTGAKMGRFAETFFTLGIVTLVLGAAVFMTNEDLADESDVHDDI